MWAYIRILCVTYHLCIPTRITNRQANMMRIVSFEWLIFWKTYYLIIHWFRQTLQYHTSITYILSIIQKKFIIWMWGYFPVGYFSWYNIIQNVTVYLFKIRHNARIVDVIYFGSNCMTLKCYPLNCQGSYHTPLVYREQFIKEAFLIACI